MSKSHELSNFIWSIAGLLHGPSRLSQYARVRLVSCMQEVTA